MGKAKFRSSSADLPVHREQPVYPTWELTCLMGTLIHFVCRGNLSSSIYGFNFIVLVSTVNWSV